MLWCTCRSQQIGSMKERRAPCNPGALGKRLTPSPLMLLVRCSSPVTQQSGAFCRVVCARYNRGTVQRGYLRKKNLKKKSERKNHGAAQTSLNGVKSNVFIISHMMIFFPVLFQWSYSHNSSRHKSQCENICALVAQWQPFQHDL